MSEVDHTAAVEAASARVSAIIRGADLADPVDHLNRWKVRDVVAHLGGIHEWATRVIQERSLDGPGFKKSTLDGAALCDWFDAGAADLVAELRKHDPAEPCPNFNPGSASVMAWWARRQAHETTVHRWDVEKALGCETTIAAALAADGVDEFLDVFVRTRGKQTLTAPLILQTTTPERVWALAPANKPGRIDVSVSPAEIDTTATQVSGSSRGLLLALWGRNSAAEAKLTITGDEQIAASLVEI